MNFKQLLGLCEHVWEFKQEIEVYDISYGIGEYPNYRKFVLQCSKCGDIKKKII